jgi:hypothetical protein
MLSRSRAGRILRTATLILAAALALGAPAHAAEKAVWGPPLLPDGSSAFGVYDELGIDTLQFSLSWADVAATRPANPRDPADPAYRWPADLDTAAAEGARHGIRISLLVANSPPWANGGRPPTFAPAAPSDYADFLAATARRYPLVRRWMIWGEPNRNDRFQPNKTNSALGPRAYARLLDAAYGALKSANRHNIVIGGNTWTSGTVKPADFLRWLRLPDGRRPRLDWWGHNPFPFRFPNLANPPLRGGFRDISDVDTLSTEVRRTFGRRVPLWLSEYTIQSDRGSRVFATFVSRPAQARYLSAGFRIADSLGPAVAGIGWLTLLDEAPAPDSANFGLLTAALQRKPAFAAMALAPSERARPAVATAATARRAQLPTTGLKVTVTPRAAGTIVVELRRAAQLAARARATGRSGVRTTLRVRGTHVAAGRYVLTVKAPHGATVRRSVRVR